MHWGKITAAAVAISCGVLVGTMLTTFANSIPPAGQPGSAEDPVVTKSYVDEQIQKVLGGQAGGSAGNAQSGTPQPTANYTIVVMKPGQTLMGGEGTEFIVRAGKAFITSNTVDGIADLTDGIDLKNDTQAPTNHLLMVAREGRGLKVDAASKGDAYVTVKGAYLHVGADGNPVLTKTP